MNVRRTPLTPIFKSRKKTGSVLVGNTPAGSLITCPIAGSVTDASMTDIQPIVVDGNYVYVGSFFDEYITAIDVSDKANPTVVDSITNSAFSGVNGLAVSGTHLYGACESGNLVSIDISDPSSMSISQAFSSGISSLDDVAISGSVAYVADFAADGIHSIDISTPSSMSILDTVTDGSVMNGAFGVGVSGNTAIITSVGTPYVASIDITTPSSMSLLDSITDGSMTDPYRVAIVGSNAYVADYQAGGGRIYSIDISTPGSLAIDQTFTNAVINGIVWISGDPTNDRVYTAGSWSEKFAAIDVSDPTALAVLGSVEDSPTSTCWGVTNAGDWVYGCDYDNGEMLVMNKTCFV